MKRIERERERERERARVVSVDSRRSIRHSTEGKDRERERERVEYIQYTWLLFHR